MLSNNKTTRFNLFSIAKGFLIGMVYYLPKFVLAESQTSNSVANNNPINPVTPEFASDMKDYIDEIDHTQPGNPFVSNRAEDGEKIFKEVREAYQNVRNIRNSLSENEDLLRSQKISHDFYKSKTASIISRHQRLYEEWNNAGKPFYGKIYEEYQDAFKEFEEVINESGRIERLVSLTNEKSNFLRKELEDAQSYLNKIIELSPGLYEGIRKLVEQDEGNVDNTRGLYFSNNHNKLSPVVIRPREDDEITPEEDKPKRNIRRSLDN